MALKSTTVPLTVNDSHPKDDQAKTLPERFKAYADNPDGSIKNKYFVYQTHDIDHSINLLLRMVSKGWKIRAAYHQFADGKSIKISDHAKSTGLINANK